jgi:hypothetical protein
MRTAGCAKWGNGPLKRLRVNRLLQLYVGAQIMSEPTFEEVQRSYLNLKYFAVEQAKKSRATLITALKVHSMRDKFSDEQLKRAQECMALAATMLADGQELDK